MKPFHTLTPLPAGKSALVLSALALATFLAAGACDQKTPTSGADYETRTPAKTVDTTPPATPTVVQGVPTTQPVSPTTRVAADNTAKNRDDMDGNTVTPLDQSESAEHIKVTADIRRAVVQDDTLSITAKNCKIITDETGRVTLRGPVSTQGEKDNIGAKARSVAGNDRVNNALEVKTN